MKKYNLIVTGGTFDSFHKGHESFLLKQFALSEKVLIGLTSDEYVKQQKGQNRENFSIRLQNLQRFLASYHKQDHVEIAQIHDSHIPSVWNTYPIEAIAVTKDTISGAERINAKRVQEGKRILPIEVIEEMKSSDGKEISSSRIRKGEIDREGNSYISDAWLTNSLFLPNHMRESLTYPLGEEFPSIPQWIQKYHTSSMHLISVGDIVTKELHEASVLPDIAAVDLKVQRKQLYVSLEQHALTNYTVITVDNPAGSLTPALWRAVQESFLKQPVVLHIIGEEDLAVLPFVLCAPLEFTILYGQPNKGVVVVTVTEDKKKRIKKIVEKFSLSASD